MAASIASRFRACMVGSVIGDCLGAPFEADFPIATSVLTKFLQEKLISSEVKGTPQVLPYTDDTAMTRSVAQSLIENKGFNSIDMAKRFTEEYFKEPRRGYGANVIHVFHLLKTTNYSDVFTPARDQFDGNGSYGNGAAMRVAPVALFSHAQENETLVELARNMSLVTHSHPDGYNGAILQCLAISLALKEHQIEQDAFVDRLIGYMDEMSRREPPQEDKPKRTRAIGKLEKRNETYSQRLNNVKLALNKLDMTPCDAALMLGNYVSAPESVPAAIYAFLRGLQPLKVFESDNPFVRTLYLSIAMGGDTDTIASMACSIAGAYHGLEVIPQQLQDRCEGIKDALNQANQLAMILEER